MKAILSLFLSLNVFCYEDVKSFTPIFQQVEKTLKSYSPSEILFVTDLDNTILTMTTDVASDQWITKQAELTGKYLKSGKRDSDLLFTDFDTLYNSWYKVQNFHDMRVTENFIPSKIKDLQNRGVHTMILTSRGNQVRTNTERLLRKYQFDFNAKPFNESLNYILGKNTKRPKKIVFKNGLAMTEGAHKGKALESLLTKLKKSYKVIFFIDDHLKNVTRVEDYFKDNSKLFAYRYGSEDHNVKALRSSPTRFKKANEIYMSQLNSTTLNIQ